MQKWLLSLLLLGSTATAQPNVDSLLHVATSQAPDTARAHAWVALGMALENREPERAFHAYGQALYLGTTSKWHCRACTRLANLHSIRQQFDSAAHYLEAAAACVSAFDHDLRTQYDYLNNRALHISRTGDYAGALAFYKQITHLSAEAIGRENVAGNQLNMANLHGKLGQPVQQQQCAYEALRIFEAIGQRTGMAYAYNLLGNIHYGQLQQYPEALAYFEKSLALRRELQDRRGEAAVLGNLGNVYEGLDSLPQAIAHHRAALDLNEALQDALAQGGNHVNLGIAYQRVGQYPLALRHLQRAVGLLGNPEGPDAARLYAEMGHVEGLLGRRTAALSHLQRSIEIARRAERLTHEEQAYDYLKKFYVREGNFREAFAAQTHQQALKDSFDQQSLRIRLSQLEGQYQLERKEQEITLLQT